MVKWFLSAVLLCTVLILGRENMFHVLCGLLQCEYSLPVETGFLEHQCCFEFLFLMVPSRRLLVVRCLFQPHRPFLNIQRTSAPILKLLLWKWSQGSIFLLNSGYLATRACESPSLDCHLEKNVSEETPKASVFHDIFLYSIPWTYPTSTILYRRWCHP